MFQGEVKLSSTFDGIMGEGASAFVYLQELNGQEVAVKVFHQCFLRRKVMKVYENLRKLEHQNICKTLGFSFQPSSLVLESCYIPLSDGDKASNLSQLLEIWNEENHINLHHRTSLIIQATEGLNYLHSNFILHKDFKPTNLLVKGSIDKVIVKVCDFDDIHALKTTTLSTMSILGRKGMTLTYIAEEILKGEQPSFKSDVFSWGLSTFEIFSNTGCPWTGCLTITTT